MWLLSKSHTWGFLCGAVVKNPPANAGDTGDAALILGLGIFPRGGNGNPLQYSCQEYPWTEEPGGLQSLGLQRVGYVSVAETNEYS